MTRAELIDLFEILFNNYPAAPISDPNMMIENWMREFGGEDTEKVYMAARYHMNTNRFFPNVADIKKAMTHGQISYAALPEENKKKIEAPKVTIEETFDTFCDMCGLCDKSDQSLCPYDV